MTTKKELEQEIAKLKDLSVACLCCDWHYESKDPYKVFKATIDHFLTHKKAWNNEQRKINERAKAEIEKLKELLVKYNKEALAYEKTVEEKTK